LLDNLETYHTSMAGPAVRQAIGENPEDDMAETIRVVREGGLVEVVLNRPDKLNSINRRMIAELHQALQEAAEAPARALLLRGEGRAFSAGRDLGEADPENENAAEVLLNEFAPLLTQIYEFRAPTIAAVQGACMGAGLRLAFACDIVITADDAQISSPFGRLGAVLDSGGHFHFAQLVGRHLALELIYTGQRLSGREAAERGLVTVRSRRRRWKGPRANWGRKSRPDRRRRFASPSTCSWAR
jgi:enoyl-CoA hydratase/carnithine racemase